MAESGALITGATGFIGRNLARRLRQKDIPVSAIVRSGSDTAVLEALGVVCYVNDGDAALLVEQMAKAKPTTVYHLAARFVGEHKPDDIAALIDTNLQFATSLVEAMARNGVDRLVNAGTSWENLSDTNAAPATLYAATKSAFEAILEFYRSAYGLRSITLRLYDTFGPDDDRPKLISLLRRIAASGEPFAMSGGAQKICPLFISDVISGFETAAQEAGSLAPGDGRIYALPGPQRVSLQEFVAVFEAVHAVKLDIRWGERPYRAREVMEPWQGALLPAWRPLVSLKEGLEICMKDAVVV